MCYWRFFLLSKTYMRFLTNDVKDDLFQVIESFFTYSRKNIARLLQGVKSEV
jgi:hypothetical protein